MEASGWRSGSSAQLGAWVWPELLESCPLASGAGNQPDSEVALSQFREAPVLPATPMGEKSTLKLRLLNAGTPKGLMACPPQKLALVKRVGNVPSPVPGLAPSFQLLFIALRLWLQLEEGDSSGMSMVMRGVDPVLSPTHVFELEHSGAAPSLCLQRPSNPFSRISKEAVTVPNPMWGHL